MFGSDRVLLMMTIKLKMNRKNKPTIIRFDLC